MKIRKAVGCFIRTKEGKFVIVKKVGERIGHEEDFWDVPKGGIEKGERAEEALFREMKEELGIEISEICDLGQDYIYEVTEKMKERSGFTHQNVRLFSANFEGEEGDISIDEDELADFRITDKDEYIRLLKFDVVKDEFRKFLNSIGF